MTTLLQNGNVITMLVYLLEYGVQFICGMNEIKIPYRQGPSAHTSFAAVSQSRATGYLGRSSCSQMPEIMAIYPAVTLLATHTHSAAVALVVCSSCL